MSQVRTGAVPPLADGYVARPELERALIDALFPGATAALVPAGAGGRGCYLDDFLARQSPDARPAALAWADERGGAGRQAGRDAPGVLDATAAAAADALLAASPALPVKTPQTPQNVIFIKLQNITVPHTKLDIGATA